MDIKKIAVIGGGQMGRQIALCAAINGYSVKVFDLIEQVRQSVAEWEDEYLTGRIAKGRMSAEQVSEIKRNFSIVGDLKEAVLDVSIVIEAVREDLEIKRNCIREISVAAPENAIIASNSSYIVSSVFAGDVTNPGRLANCHFYNPALVMKFVEVVQGPHTSEVTAQSLMDFCRSLGKDPICMKKELPGFAANYINRGIQDRARWLVQNGYCTPQEVDMACEKGLNHPMGPFRLNDFTGIDLAFEVAKNRYEQEGIKPDMYDVLEQMVKEGKLGRKSGHGFYDYE